MKTTMTIDITPSVEGFARISYGLSTSIMNFMDVIAHSRSPKTIHDNIVKLISANDSLREIDTYLKSQGYTGTYNKPLV